MNPVFYDFKRAFLRPVTLIALAVFILAGIGLSYLVSISLSTRIGDFYSEFLAKLNLETGEFTLYYNIYDLEGKPLLANVETTLSVFNKISEFTPENEQPVKRFSFTAKGYYVFKTTLEKSVIETLANPDMDVFLKIASSTPLGYWEIGKVLLKLNGSEAVTSDPMILFIPASDIKLPIFSAGHVFLRDDELIISVLIEPPGQGFQLYFAISSDETTPDINNATLVGDVSTGLNVYRVNLSDFNVNITTETIIKLFLKSSESGTYSSDMFRIIRLETGRTQREITGIVVGSPALEMFSQFFPIVMLYLAYALVAKPKGIGALEFLIARPVTRWEVYFTRFVAGVLTALVSAGVFLATSNVGIVLLTGYGIESSHVVTLFIGVTGSLIAFYSLCYMLSTVVSGGKYLAVSIFLYLFFTIIMNIIVFIIAYLIYGLTPRLGEEVLGLQYISYYFNPLEFTSFATYFVSRALYPGSIPEVSVVDPYLIATAGVAWILGPFILGWMLFRKANLSR